MERSSIFIGATHYFDWAIFNSYLSLPEAHMDWICQVWNLSFSQTAGRQRTTQAVQVEQGLRADGCTSMRFKVQTIAWPKWWRVCLKIGFISQMTSLTGENGDYPLGIKHGWLENTLFSSDEFLLNPPWIEWISSCHVWWHRRLD